MANRETDTLAVFPCPEVDEQGQYHLYFFLHGLRHLPSSAIERINQLEFGQKLWLAHASCFKSGDPLNALAHEFQNPYDSQALILNTEDHYILGYCPRYLLAEVFELLRQNYNLEVQVERVNHLQHQKKLLLLSFTNSSNAVGRVIRKKSFCNT